MNSVSLQPVQTGNLVDGEYVLTIEGSELWPLQYLVYDHIARRRAYFGLSKHMPPYPTLGKNSLVWNATPLQWLQAFGGNGEFAAYLSLLSQHASEDPTSQDRCTYLRTRWESTRLAYVTTDAHKHSKKVLTVVTADATQQELESLVTPRIIKSKTGWPIGSKATDGVTVFNGFNFSQGVLNRVENALLEAVTPIIIYYPVESLFEMEYEKRHGVSLVGATSLDNLARFYQPAHDAVQSIAQEQYTHNAHYHNLVKLINGRTL